MIRAILERARQGYRTTRYPKGEPPALSPRFRGRPEIDASLCGGCGEGGNDRACAKACPVGAIRLDAGTPTGPNRRSGPRLDLGLCIFCAECERVCPERAIDFSKDCRLATRGRAELVLGPGDARIELAHELDAKLKRLFGRSLKLRQVSAGGCNACEADANVLGTVGWDFGRFGIQFVASPRHADALLVTGPVARNMELALRKTYQAMSEPRLVIASGACAISGGIYADSPEALGGVAAVLPVDLYVPGCPPHPLTLLDGLLRLLGRIEEGPR
jgi:Ni,Fe-hydrogenase III small subunit/NAD-dependent dihydropyrimidine dehydrogenase PreA subunit